jgi:protein involved in sex pheromone biosynthesis
MEGLWKPEWITTCAKNKFYSDRTPKLRQQEHEIEVRIKGKTELIAKTQFVCDFRK